MQRRKAYWRFPRTSYVRRLEDMMQAVWDFNQRLSQEAEVAQSAYLEARLRERAAEMDTLWHDLEAATRTLGWMR